MQPAALQRHDDGDVHDDLHHPSLHHHHQMNVGHSLSKPIHDDNDNDEDSNVTRIADERGSNLALGEPVFFFIFLLFFHSYFFADERGSDIAVGEPVHGRRQLSHSQLNS